MTTIEENGLVSLFIENNIAVIEFFHPQSNSLPGNILRKLATTIREADANDVVKLMVLQSKGEKVFCSGASFNELSSINSEEEGIYFFSGFAEVINAMRTAKKLIIAKVQGKCVGGGVGLAAAADYVFALSKADIKLSELAVGIGPFVVGPAVERKLGLSAFSQLSIDAASWRSANWAQQHGLFTEVFEDVSDLNKAADKLIGTLANSSSEAMYALKKVFWQGTEHWDTLLKERAAISGRLILSDFSKNFIANFKAKQQ
ncbi:MAG: enoyl-CoA hydratase/isomerase family protein [Sphingobacteriia bacterium]|nr:enoyl-CoA hydratase/isomerase family protein [Sphingobacteriia bacterium]